jgi:hypothetical protein
VPVEPALIRHQGYRQQRHAGKRDGNLDRRARGRLLGRTIVTWEGHRQMGCCAIC